MRRPGQDTEAFAWLAAIPAALVTVAALLWLAPPLSPLLDPPGEQHFFAGAQPLVLPEPEEDMRFLLAIAAVPLLAALVLFVSPPWGGDRRLTVPVVAAQISGLGLVGACLAAQTHVANPLPASSGFDPAVLSFAQLLSGCAIGGVLTVLAFRGRMPAMQWQSSRPRRRRVELSVLALAALVTALWLLPAIYTDDNIGASEETVVGHAPFQAEEYWAVLNGLTPLSDFTTQYTALLPFAVAPAMSLLGPSWDSYTFLMALLSLLALLSVYETFALIARRPAVALALYLPFLAFALFPITRHGDEWTYNANIYSVFPARYLGPLAVGWLCARLLTGRGGRPWLVFAAAGVAALNNPDFGLPCLGAALAAVWLGTRAPGWGIRFLAGQAAIGVAAAVALVSALILLRATSFPDLGSLFYFSHLFAREGFGLLPMPELGLHIVMYLTYAACLVAAAVRRRTGAEDGALTGLLAYAAVLGLGSGAYFAGRSAASNLITLFPVWGLALELLALTSVQAIGSSRERGRSVRALALPAFAALFGVGVMLTTLVQFPAPWAQVSRIGSTAPAGELETGARERLVAGHTRDGENIAVLATSGHAIAERAEVHDVTPIAARSIVTEEQMGDALEALQNAGGCRVFTAEANPREIARLREAGFVRERSKADGMRSWRTSSCD